MYYAFTQSITILYSSVYCIGAKTCDKSYIKRELPVDALDGVSFPFWMAQTLENTATVLYFILLSRDETF